MMTWKPGLPRVSGGSIFREFLKDVVKVSVKDGKRM